jgi:AcrR family transcriptional regulator
MATDKDSLFGNQARSVELLWGQEKRPSRGPKPALSTDRIVRAAIGIADTEGLAAVSMQRVASEFGFTTMSLYRYVPGKEQLIDLMIDTAAGEPPALSAMTGGWRPKLAEWARQTAAIFHRHPWFLSAVPQRIMGPQQLGWLECAVAALDGSGLAGDDLVGAVLAVNGQVRSMAPFAVDQTTGPDDLTPEQWGSALVHLMLEHPEKFPALNTAIAAGAFGPPDGDGMDFGLNLVLDGIEALIARRAGNR